MGEVDIMRFLGIDHGESKIGLALGDNEAKIVLPYKILSNEDFFSNVNGIIKDESIDEIVLGLPKNLNNKETQQTNIVYDFLNKLKKIINIPIHLEDERMTSILGKKMQGKSKKAEDASAAALILDSFLRRNYN